MKVLNRLLKRAKLTFLKKSNQNIFNDIYKNSEWGNGSGVGSTIEATREYRVFLTGFMNEHNVHSVVDAGCGDWQFSKLMNWDNINYIGIDVAQSIIKTNIVRYSKKNVRFICADLVDTKFPKADLLILKDVLQHLSNRNVNKIISKFVNFKYVIVVNDFAEKNKDIPNGWHRGINLEAPPLNVKLFESSFLGSKQVCVIKNE